MKNQRREVKFDVMLSPMGRDAGQIPKAQGPAYAMREKKPKGRGSEWARNERRGG